MPYRNMDESPLEVQARGICGYWNSPARDLAVLRERILAFLDEGGFSSESHSHTCYPFFGRKRGSCNHRFVQRDAVVLFYVHSTADTEHELKRAGHGEIEGADLVQLYFNPVGASIYQTTEDENGDWIRPETRISRIMHGSTDNQEALKAIAAYYSPK